MGLPDVDDSSAGNPSPFKLCDRDRRITPLVLTGSTGPGEPGRSGAISHGEIDALDALWHVVANEASRGDPSREANLRQRGTCELE